MLRQHINLGIYGNRKRIQAHKKKKNKHSNEEDQKLLIPDHQTNSIWARPETQSPQLEKLIEAINLYDSVRFRRLYHNHHQVVDTQTLRSIILTQSDQLSEEKIDAKIEFDQEVKLLTNSDDITDIDQKQIAEDRLNQTLKNIEMMESELNKIKFCLEEIPKHVRRTSCQIL
ncbi:MAG: hypothetical protein A3F11_11900 [Gammaproteobacteria bacterium RIFCSPHIGHO2_12_FULL_37_14]|nr:MAG: hypothetical protein A3F11_11900 [Gammaproteobacteria bacterium RIFCSPHIGHO2_12_FULL_37_14]